MSKRPEWEVLEEKKQILKEQRQDCIEAQKSKMDRKAELLALERRFQMERLDREMEEKVEKERKLSLDLLDKLEKEKRLAAEMSNLQREEVRNQKVREQLKETSEELKTLETKLRAGYVNKQLTAQIAEKEVAAAQEKLEKFKIQKMIEAENICMEEQARQKEKSYLENKLQYREELLNQIKEGNKKEQDKQRDLILEKALLEQSMRKLREEEEKEKETRLERLNNMKKEIVEFQRQNEIRKEREKKEREEEDKRINEYVLERQQKEDQRKNELKEKEALKNKIRDQITNYHLSKLQSKTEREEILAYLAEEEIRQRDLEKDKDKADAAEKFKTDFINYFTKLEEERQIAWNTDFQEQERYRNQLLNDLKKESKSESSSYMRKLLKSKELREALLNQMKDRHRRKVEEWQRESALYKLKEIEEKERLRLVEEERMHMLKKHAANLGSYLPRGVLHEHYVDHLQKTMTG